MNPIADVIAAALIHSLWQGAVVALLVSLALVVLRNQSAEARYTVGLAGLGLLFLAPFVTGWILLNPPMPMDGGPVSETISSTMVEVGATSLTYLTNTGSEVASPLSGSLLGWVFTLWATGVCLFSLRLLWAARWVSRLRRKGRAADPGVVGSARALARRMGIRRSFRVVNITVGEGPGVVGWLRPVVFLPPALALGLTVEQLEAILAHELAHIRRHDYLVNVFQMAVETLMFFNPAVWWISGRIRHERELCCDDVAIGACGDAVGYARALTQLEKLRMTPQPAVGSTGGSLTYRVRRIIGQPGTGWRIPSRIPALLTMALAVGGGLLMLQSLEAQEPSIVPLAVPPGISSLPLSSAPEPASPGVGLPVTPAEPPTAIPAPAQPAALVPPAPLSALLQDNVGMPAWVLYRSQNGTTTTVTGYSDGGSQLEAPTADSLGGGDVLWYQWDGRAWIVRDPGVLDEVVRVSLTDGTTPRADQAEIETQLRRTRTEIAELEAEIGTSTVSTSALREQLEQLSGQGPEDATLDDLREWERSLARVQEQIQRMQARIQDRGELESRQRELRALEGEIIMAQAEAQKIQEPLGNESTASRLDEIFQRAIDSGLAVPAP